MIIGLLVNPIAGMGGRVGLKGTDGVYEEAVRRGAVPVASGRAQEFLEALAETYRTLDRPTPLIMTCPGRMGAECVEASGLKHRVIKVRIHATTSSSDTVHCVRSLHENGVRLLVFVGGDGTARDIYDSIARHGIQDLLVLGVPSGVKMYSGIFVINPRDAAGVVRLVDEGTATPAEFEVMDADEQAFRQDRFIIRLYGYLKGPSVPARFQGAKQASPETTNEREAQEAIARYLKDRMVVDGTYVLGPGTTMKAFADLLGIKKTVLGVDLYRAGETHNDLSESQLLELIRDYSKTWIIVSPIGHQGLLFGRGNQQISPVVIERVGRDRIWIVCTPAKLGGIEGGTLKVDTGDERIDRMLHGYIRVVTDYAEIRLVKVE